MAGLEKDQDPLIVLKERDTNGNLIIIDCEEVWGKDGFVFGKPLQYPGKIVQVPLANVLYFIKRDQKV